MYNHSHEKTIARSWLREEILSAIALAALFFSCAALFFLNDLSYWQLQRKFIPGTHGATLISANTDLRPSFKPWEILERNISLNGALQALCDDAGLEPECYRESHAHFELFTEEHRVESESAPYTLIRNSVPLSDNDITPDLLKERMSLLIEWARNNQREDGSFPYLYYPSEDLYPDSDYYIRQILTIQGLYAVGQAIQDEKSMAMGSKGEQRMERFYHDAGEYSYVVDSDGEIRLGAAALAILMSRESKAPEEPASRKELEFGEFILRMQRENGSFQTYLQDEPTDVEDMFYSGEALSALALLASATDDTRYDDALQLSFSHYKKKLAEDFWPQYSPWHAMAYTLAYEKTPNEEYASYVFWVADALIETLLNHDTDALPDEVGRFFNADYPEWGTSHSASTGIYVEGLTYAYELAKLRGDIERMERYRSAILSGTRYLLQVQWTPEMAYYVKERERVVGTFKVSIKNHNHRIDQLGHAANALARVYTIVLHD